MAEDIILTKGLNKVYGDRLKVSVLKDINIAVRVKSFTALIGPSGSGKSTLLNCLGLIDAPTSGSIIIDKTEFSSVNVNGLASFRNLHMGFVFQFHYLLPEFTALENVLMPGWIRSGRPENDVKEYALQIMERIGILKEKEKFPAEMSGGQQQRVAIARALINKPKLIFADEPTGNLDRETGFEVLKLMKEINAENGTTLLIVTHDREIALAADHIIELVDGRICKQLDVKKTGKTAAAKEIENRSCRIQ
ncbi:MAG: ABC transporter ATP-binding protein [Candidatus Firestonebacteria bacterium]|nr:ABC transporter ATP-binding protein [Candidatus Firestonebacteria bacterium]